ncbi:MAG: tetratricopeptide repeat protein, partial [Candidatus Acidiferrales bacterium]
VFERKKQLERAVHELRRSAELDPTYPQPHYALARIYKQQSDLEAAERELRLFTKLRAIDNRKGIVRPD